MLKKLYFIFFLVLVATTKKNQEEEHSQTADDQCAHKMCKDEYNACNSDKKCIDIIVKCNTLMPNDRNPTFQQTLDYIDCLEDDTTAYKYADCIQQKCFTVDNESKHKRKFTHKTRHLYD